MPDGSWQPCPTHDALQATVKNGAKGYERWRATNGADTSFLAPHVKALSTALQRQHLVADQLTRVKAIGQAIGGGQAANDQDGVDHDGDGVIFDGTPNERAAPKKGSGNRAAAADAKKRRNARRDYLASRDTDKGPKATQANQREERLNRAVAREQLRGWEPTANGRGLRPAAGRRGAMGPAGPRSRQGAVSVEPGSQFSPSTRASTAEETRWAPGAADAPKGRGRKSADESMMETEEHFSPHLLTLRQMSLVRTFELTVEEYGPFNQGVGPDGAHYVAQSPFADEGMVCSNCALYEGPRGCEIVAGDIAPEAICKFWVIPEDLLTEKDNS